MPQDRRFMWHAIELARRGLPYVAPNPMVGAVLVKDGQIVGEGFHEKFGAPHAEAVALERAGDNAKGATLYVNLEPCCQTYEAKKTPPCAPRLIQAGVKRVVIAHEDPFPAVQGLGVKALAEAGIEVAVGECADEARELNAAYLSLVERGRPLVTAKWAMTLDGKIATRTGDARWISGEESRKEVHFDRGCAGALVVGIGTALRDDPLLTARGDAGRQPLRVVIDRELRLPTDSRLARTVDEGPVLVFCADDVPEEKREALTAAGVQVAALARADGRLRWDDILAELGGRSISSAIVEGGGGVFATAFQESAIDRVKIYIAPKIFGGQEATTPVEGAGVPDVQSAITFDHVKTRGLGEDIVIEGRVAYR